MKTFKEFFQLGVTKPSKFDVQNYLNHLGTRLMQVPDIKRKIINHFKNIKNLKLDPSGSKVLSFEEFNPEINEDIKVPIEIGDTILGGRFKNKKVIVKEIGKNEKGDITINGRPLLKYRLLP
tara:strand:+ start:3170 stop:3535 length:366 start_codon:yes stop_codon:yes gene_type:complete